jgi:hypothetical protein
VMDSLVVRVCARDLRVRLCNCGSVRCVCVAGNYLLRPWQQVLTSMVIEHAVYPSFRALPVGVSEAHQRDNRTKADRHLGNKVSQPRRQSLHRLQAGKLC